MLGYTWPLVTYSNYFEIVSTVTFLYSRIGLNLGLFLYKTVILYRVNIYLYTIIMIVQSLMFAGPGF